MRRSAYQIMRDRSYNDKNYFRPVVWFRKKNGVHFSKRFTSREAALRAVRGWRAAGGKVVKLVR